MEKISRKHISPTTELLQSWGFKRLDKTGAACLKCKKTMKYIKESRLQCHWICCQNKIENEADGKTVLLTDKQQLYNSETSEMARKCSEYLRTIQQQQQQELQALYQTLQQKRQALYQKHQQRIQLQQKHQQQQLLNQKQ